MKKKKTQISSTPKDKKFKWVLLGVGASVLLLPFVVFGLIKLLVLVLNANPGWFSPSYEFHHPALYQCQRDWFKFGDNIIRGYGSSLYIVKGGQESPIDFDYSFHDYCVSNDVLYIMDFNGVYAYNTEFVEIDRYEIKTSLGYLGCFIVKGDYIYYEKNYDIYKYSMITRQEECLCHIGSDGTYLSSEQLCFSLNLNGSYGFVDLQNDNYFYPSYTHTTYNYYYGIHNEKYGIAHINDRENQLVINEKFFDIGTSIRLGNMIYASSDYLMLYTYNPCCDDCYLGQSCISQLKEVKLWKYDLEKETLSLIKEFNDYTILIAFDDNNYHYYYDGKLYSNDVVIEELPFKLEVGNMFTYYAYNSPNFQMPGVAISDTKFGYIDGKFYYVRYDYPENNEVEEVDY